MKVVIDAINDRISGKVPLLRKRSSRWPTVRKDFLIKNNSCAACGQIDHLQVHHIEPFHLNPSLELDESNLITLCEDEYLCHLHIGHLGSFKDKNPNVRIDAANNLIKHQKSE